MPTVTNVSACAGGDHITITLDNGEVATLERSRILEARDSEQTTAVVCENIKTRLLLAGAQTPDEIAAELTGAVFRA